MQFKGDKPASGRINLGLFSMCSIFRLCCPYRKPRGQDVLSNLLLYVQVLLSQSVWGLLSKGITLFILQRVFLVLASVGVSIVSVFLPQQPGDSDG